ncbi:MAG: hypothetical protein GY711_15690 [bacterium]|nr:hypothetical protein [bacterium]
MILQVGHSTPETAQASILTGARCPDSGASGHCQKSTKVVAEAKSAANNMGEFGIRFRDRDVQSLTHQVCGCSLVADVQLITVQFTITGGTALPAADPTNPGAADFGLYHCPIGFMGPQNPLMITGAGIGTGTFEVAVTRGDFPQCPDYTPPGFGLCIETYPNGDTDEVEDVEIQITGAWVGDSGTGTPMTDPAGWNHTFQWIIEEGD